MTARISASEARKLLAKPKRKSKYRAVRTQVDGIWFDSKGEASRFHELKMFERANKIWLLKRQVKYPLHAAGDGMKIGEYIADFTYSERARKAVVVEDYKGFDTPLAKWKRRHLQAEYGVVVKLSRKGRSA